MKNFEPVAYLCFSAMHFLNSNFSLWKYEEIKKDQKEIFIVLGELCLTKTSAPGAAVTAVVHGLATRAAATVANGAYVAASHAADTPVYDIAYQIYDKIRKNALNEFEETGEIKGYEVYLVSLNKKVWIGKEDWENFYKLNAK